MHHDHRPPWPSRHKQLRRLRFYHGAGRTNKIVNCCWLKSAVSNLQQASNHIAFTITNKPTPTAGPSSVASTIITNDFAIMTLPRTTQPHANTRFAPGYLHRQPSPLPLGQRNLEFSTKRYNAHAINAISSLVASLMQKISVKKAANCDSIVVFFSVYWKISVALVFICGAPKQRSQTFCTQLLAGNL